MFSYPWHSKQVGIAYHDNLVNVVLLEKTKSRTYCRPLVGDSQTAQNLNSSLHSLSKQIGQANVVIGLAAHQVMHKEVQLDPYLTENEIQRFIEENAVTLFGTQSHQLFYDWEFFQSDVHKPLSLRISAAPRTTVQPIINLCSAYELKPIAIETNTHAYQRLLQYLKLLSTELVGIAFCEKTTTLLAVMQNSNILFNNIAQKPCAINELLNQFDAQYPHYPIQTLFIHSDAPIPNEMIDAIPVHIASINLSPLLLPAFENEFAEYASACGLALRGYT